jgi:hypothetical protein
MNIGILHLSDLHIKSDCEFWDSKPAQIVSATRNDFHSCDKVFIVCTGDVAFSGREEEYLIATIFFDALKSLLNQIHYNKCSKISIIAPGNHDCDFSRESQLRSLALNNLSYDILDKDNSVTNNALVVQENFFKFLERTNGIATYNKLAYKYQFDIDGYKVCFLCLNTAWCSRPKENVGSLFFPVSLTKDIAQGDCNILITLFHHHPAWLTPNTTPNNRNEFIEFINSESDMALLGHEHANNIEIGSDTNGNYTIG